MTKPKSPKRAASPSARSTNASAKHSIGAAAAALHAATTTATTTSAFERHSPPPSPRHLRHKDTSPPSSPSSSGPTAVSKEVKATVKGALNDVKDVMNLAAKEFGAVAENKEFTSMESRAETAAAAAAAATEAADTADISPSAQRDLAAPDQSMVSFPSPMSSSSSSSSTSSPSSSSFTTVTGSGARSGSGLGDGTGSGSIREGGRPIPPPAAARSYLSNNLFASLSLDQDSTDKNRDGHESDRSNSNISRSSESSDDSDLDDTSSSESSESSNSSQPSEGEEEDEDEEDEEEEEAEEEQHERRIDPSHTREVDSGKKAGPLLKKRWRKKPEQDVLEAQQQPSKAPTPLHDQQHQQQHHHQQQHQLQHQHHQHSSLDNRGEPVNESVVLLADQSAKAKWANWSVRTLWTLIMIGGFFACVAAGPAFVILLVVMVQGLVYKEVIYLAAVPSREKKLPWFRAMNWYFLFSTNYFFYGESLIHYFQHVVFVDAFLVPFATHHRFISFTLYVIGFVFFVANLKKGHYRFQFSQFAWTHMTLLLVVCQSHFIINNIFEGLIWFFLPVSLVIANDIWAYIFGFFWGKTPLIKLSPKKTVEGFVGGWIMTIVFGMLFATLFLQYPYMICPVKDLRATAFSGLTCDPNPVFIPVKYYLKPWMVSLVRHLGLRNNYVMIAPLQPHAIFMACFASLIAPFGGFFASGFKRAFKIKDFGQSIPGHGGITDRMDCQFLMGLFSYMYYQSFIKTSAITVGAVLQSAIHNLNGQDQMELFDHMRQYLIGQGLLDEESCVIIPPKEAWIS